jgi:uncharacterized protein DUF397
MLPYAHACCKWLRHARLHVHWRPGRMHVQAATSSRSPRDDTASHIEKPREHTVQVNNGVPADKLVARWRKSLFSNPTGSCVEVAELPDGAIAVRNSRHPHGPALIYTRAEVAAFLSGVKNGEFDDLCMGGTSVLGAQAARKVARWRDHAVIW